MSETYHCPPHGERSTYVAPFVGYIPEPSCTCTMLPPTQPPAAPEGDVSAWVAELTEAHRDSYPMGNIHHGTPERPDWGTFCVECRESWPCDVSRLLEHVRVVEGEREEWRARALSNAEQCDRNWAEACLAVSRAESAEAALAELRAGVEALAEEWGADFMAFRKVDPAHLKIRALLGDAL